MFNPFKKNTASNDELLERIANLEKKVASLEEALAIPMVKPAPVKENTEKAPKKQPAAKALSRYEQLEQQGKARKAEEKEQNIQKIMEKSGWSHAETVAHVEAARKLFGISYKEFNQHDFHAIPLTQQKEKYEEITAQKKKRKADRLKKKNAGYIADVVKATGWDPEYAEEKMKQAKKANGASYEHYAIYRFWELSEDVQKTYFSKGDADKLRDKFNKNNDVLRVFMNKDLFCKNFDQYLGRPWLSTAGMTLEDFKTKFSSEKKVMYKPRASSGGHGIEVFKIEGENIEEVFNKISALPEGIIEGYLVQHHEMSRLSTNSVNTIRVVTIQTNEDMPGIEKNKVHFVYCGVRMGQGSSYVDNLHSGGMIAAIDIDTGIVDTHAVNFANDVFERHPDTNVQIKGFQIPYFKEIKELIEDAGRGIPGYLGWDIAITETGPVIVELNTHPGADGLQTPYVLDRKGMRHVLAKYLDEPVQNRTPETPYGTKISGILKEGIEFYWKKLEIADGYEIFRSYHHNRDFERIAVIEKRSIGTYIDSEFDHSKKKVYYTVRSYVDNADGTRTFSETVDAQVAEFRNKLELERTATYMYSGSTRNIRAFWGWGEVEDPQWTSSDENVATISADGIITAKAAGSCTLTCASSSIGQSADTLVVVDRQAVEPLGEITSRYQLNGQTGHWENKDASATNDAVIMMVGDMMCGKRQMQEQYTEAQGWNFNDSFEFVKEITATSDFAIGNLETLLAAGWPYMLDETYIDNMNNCNATSRYLDAVRYGGFDAVAMSNNHNCDGGRRALLETIDQVERYQLAHTGVFRGESDPRFFIANVNGIKVGYVAYISRETGFNGKDSTWSAEDMNTLLNVFNAAKAEQDIAACRAAGAEYVIAYMHWGFKNFRNLAKHQKAEALAVANAGADYIVGANPHLVQVYDVVTTEDGRVVPCAYSIGNFQAVMNQVTGNRDSVILRIRLRKDETGKVTLAENHYIPCFTYNKCENSLWAPVAVSKNFNTEARKKNRKKIQDRIADTIGSAIKEFA